MKTVFGQQTTKVKQLADLICLDISLGKYKIGCALPSINHLSSDYNVSRDTVFKAFADLKKRGVIDSTPGKGYYVINQQKKVLLLLDEYSLFKDTLYNNFVKHLSRHYKVDLWFHQYNEHMFNRIIKESLGNYNYYVVMNFDNEKFSKNLYKIDESKLLLLDFGKFDKKNYSYICQDFDDSFYKAMVQLRPQLCKYKRIVLFYPQELKHPRSITDNLDQYSEQYNMPYEMVSTFEEANLQKGDVVIVFRQIDVVTFIKESRVMGLECGVDFGLIAYNETPAYEVIDKGITSLSIDWKEMGRLASQFIMTGVPVHTYLPTEIKLRESI